MLRSPLLASAALLCCLLGISCRPKSEPAPAQVPSPASDSARVPALLGELPEGDIATWSGKEELARMGSHQNESKLAAYREADEYAVLRTGGSFVHVLKGKFDLAKVDEHFAKTCERQTIDGDSLWIATPGRQGGIEIWTDYEAAHTTADRVVVGSKSLVAAALRVREGKAKSFASTLTADEKSAITVLSWKTQLLVARSTPGARSGRPGLDDLTRAFPVGP